jgi:DNA primase
MKAASDKVLSTLEQYIDGPIRKAGPTNVIMRCPFHTDNSPSFAMNTQNGLYICYACGEKGTFNSFLRKVGLTSDEIRYHYGQTLKSLKDNLPPPPDPTKPGVVVHDTNAHIPGDILGMFHKCPEDLLDDGFDEETLLHFGIGVDEYHNRTTYPLRDLHGNLVGISGRARLEHMESRYKVYKEEYRHWELPPYDTDKSNLLWNAHVVFPEVMKASNVPIVIVEGFKACMWVWQAQVPNVVGLMTKTLSWAQRWILQKMGGPFILMLDNDDAGIDGTITISKELATFCPDVRIVEYDALQPDGVPREEVKGLIQSATDYQLMALF